jgi:DNA polymerase-1
MKNRIFIIDGSSYLYRAYHAMPPLSTSTGKPTGAVKGVTNMLMNLKKESEGSPIIVVFDAKGKNFRHTVYEEYKSNRPPMPDDLREQLKPVKDICKAIGFPLLEVEGVEADDVIATLVAMARKKDFYSVVSSLDKDLMQLVEDPFTTLMNTMTHKTFDETKVFEKFGVKPSQIRDMLALVGDTSDNIPGVPKVGQKTAAKWLNEYEDLDTIKANAESFPGVVGNNLREFLPNLDRNVELVSLKRDLDLKTDFESLLVLNNDDEALEKLYEEFEFKPLRNSPVKKTAEEVAVVNSKYETIDKLEDLEKWAKQLDKCIAFAIDTETSSLDTITADLLGISLSIEEGKGCYVPIGHDYDGAPKQLSLDKIVSILGKSIEKKSEKSCWPKLKI